MNYWIHAGLANAVLALVPGLLALLCQWRGGHARVVRALWVLALVKLLTPPVIGLPVGLLSEEASSPVVSTLENKAVNVITSKRTEITAVMTEVKPEEAAAPVAIAVPEPVAHADNAAAMPVTRTSQGPAKNEAFGWSLTWENVVGALWCGGAVVVLGWGAYQINKFRRLAKTAQKGSEELQLMAERVGGRLRLRKLPEIGLLEVRMSPVLWGLAPRPRILLPRGLWEGLTRREREALLAHELAHFGRGDHWVRWIEFAAQVIYWWHPLVWAGARQMRRAEEEATDGAIVSALPEHSADYARALLAVVDLVAGTRWRVPAGGSGMSEFTDLTKRMEMIMKPTTRKMHWAAWAVLAAGSLALVPVLPVGGAGVSATPVPAVAAADPATPTPSVSAPQTGTSSGVVTNDEAARRLENERQRMEDARDEDERRQLEDARRKMADLERQQQAAAERGRIADQTAVRLRELELREFMDIGKELTTAQLQAELSTQQATVQALDAKSKRLADLAKNKVISEEEVDDVNRNLETARGNANIAALQLESWKKYGIAKRQLQLQQQLEEAQRTDAIRGAGIEASSTPASPVAPAIETR